MFSLFERRPLVTADTALPGRAEAMVVPGRHAVLGTSLQPPFPTGIETALFALGCFWGAERLFWSRPGIHSTSVGYSGGFTANPTYHEVCSGRTGHAETVLVAFDPARIGYEALLRLFWESHDPTQGMRQGADIGSQYRSALFPLGPAQHEVAQASRQRYQAGLTRAGRGGITTEITAAGPFYWAEPDHQQYLAHHPDGYCGLAGTGVCLD